ncbi:MAG: class I SAM-dependent methyltransferase [Candidatus Atribacteria bacterium]|nr:MAG: class I SAM-dependent methyltransferase [Candidatus Atribacteria bacterium]
MKQNKILTRSSIIISLSFISVVLLSQEKVRNIEYHPELGQEGKDVRWFPTPQLLVDRMLDMAKITPEDFLIDLGSGDGRTVITAAKRGLHAIGIEYNPDLVKLSKENAVKEKVADKVDFIEADLFAYDFSKATVITMFLLPEINLKLRPRLLDMKPGTRIVSTTFTMQNWQYDEVVKIDDKTSKWTTAYLWIVPAKVEGTWNISGGDIKLTQEFQMISGKLNMGGKSIEISDGRLRGSDITFISEGVRYDCRVYGNTMKGTSAKDGKVTAWEAIRQK